MTKDLKFVPVAPKTYEVKYVENKQSGLSPAARAKVIKMNGSSYQSSRATINNPGYGPGIDGAEVKKYCSKCKKDKEVETSDNYCSGCGVLFESAERAMAIALTKSDVSQVAKDEKVKSLNKGEKPKK
jgi:hypothetical protein